MTEFLFSMNIIGTNKTITLGYLFEISTYGLTIFNFNYNKTDG